MKRADWRRRERTGSGGGMCGTVRFAANRVHETARIQSEHSDPHSGLPSRQHFCGGGNVVKQPAVGSMWEQSVHNCGAGGEELQGFGVRRDRSEQAIRPGTPFHHSRDPGRMWGWRKQVRHWLLAFDQWDLTPIAATTQSSLSWEWWLEWSRLC
jgi:hypothetical protein